MVRHGPELLRDFGLRNQPFVAATDLKIEQAKCTIMWYLASHCTVDYSSPTGPKQSLSYFFLGPTPEKRVQLLRSSQDRNLIVGDVGLSHLWNRVLCMIAFSAGMVLVAFVGMRNIAAA